MFEANKKYKVKAIDAGLGETRSGAAQPWIRYQNVESADVITQYLNVTGSTPEGKAQAEEITAEALITAGFAGNDISDLSKPFQMMFPNTPEVTIKIVSHEYNGKKTLKVKGPYAAGSAPKKFAGAAPKMAAAFAKARQALGAKPPTVAKTQEDSPF
jgi:hypothetical protein